MKWLSGHIFFDGDIYGPQGDQVILSIIKPFILECKRNNYILSYFFIRYSELGSHVRLRLYGENKILDEFVKPLLVEYVTVKYIENIICKKGILSSKNDNMPSISWISYIPEIERYGGSHAIKIAEKYFYASSKIAIHLIAKIGNDRDRKIRLGKCSILMMIFLYVFFGNKRDVIIFTEQNCENYLRSIYHNDLSKINSVKEKFISTIGKQSILLINNINSIWNIITEGDFNDKELGFYYQDLVEIKNDLTKFTYDNLIIPTALPISKMILPSFIHMMNNRMGISMIEEAYLSSLISKTLKQKVYEN